MVWVQRSCLIAPALVLLTLLGGAAVKISNLTKKQRSSFAVSPDTPEIIDHPQNIFATKGEKFTIDCTFKISKIGFKKPGLSGPVEWPLPEVSMYRESKDVAREIKEDERHNLTKNYDNVEESGRERIRLRYLTLTVTDVEASDAGIYRCVLGEWSNLLKYTTYKILVTVREEISKGPQGIFSFNCTSNESRWQVIFPNNTKINITEKTIPMNVTQGSLKVSNPQMFENATFQCYNTLNDIIISQKLTTTTHQEVNLTQLRAYVEYLPVINCSLPARKEITQKSSVTVHVDDACSNGCIKLECGNDSATNYYEWYKNGKRMEEHENHSVIFASEICVHQCFAHQEDKIELYTFRVLPYNFINPVSHLYFPKTEVIKDDVVKPNVSLKLCWDPPFYYGNFSKVDIIYSVTWMRDDMLIVSNTSETCHSIYLNKNLIKYYSFSVSVMNGVSPVTSINRFSAIQWLNTSVELTECNSTNMKISVTSPLFKYIQNNISYYFGSAWPILYYNFNTTSVDEQKLLSSLFTYNYVNNWRSGTPKQNCKEDSEFCKKAKMVQNIKETERIEYELQNNSYTFTFNRGDDNICLKAIGMYITYNEHWPYQLTQHFPAESYRICDFETRRLGTVKMNWNNITGEVMLIATSCPLNYFNVSISCTGVNFSEEVKLQFPPENCSLLGTNITIPVESVGEGDRFINCTLKTDLPTCEKQHFDLLHPSPPVLVIPLKHPTPDAEVMENRLVATVLISSSAFCILAVIVILAIIMIVVRKIKWEKKVLQKHQTILKHQNQKVWYIDKDYEDIEADQATLCEDSKDLHLNAILEVLKKEDLEKPDPSEVESLSVTENGRPGYVTYHLNA